MSNPEHSARTPSLRTAVFATLRAASIRAKGSGAPSSGASRGSAAPSLRLFGLLTVILACALALTAAPASAATHSFSFSFNGADAPTGGFAAGPIGLAVDHSSGDVWVGDQGHGVLDEFTPAGAYVPGSQIAPPGGGSGGLYHLAVDNSGGPSAHDIYVADIANNVIDKLDPSSGELVSSFGSSGQLGGFSLPIGVAVDASGHLYVADLSAGVVDKFNENGTPDPTTPVIGSGQLSSPRGLAVDASGHLYVAGGEGVREFDSSGTCLNACAPLEGSGGASGTAYGVAVDPATQDVYATADEGREVAAYDSSGNPLETFGEGHLSQGIGIDVSGPSVFVAENVTNSVNVFGSSGPTQPLTVEVSGEGAVESSPAGIGGCDEATSPCEFPFAEGSTVTLTPSAHHRIKHWTGCSSEPNPNTCEVEMSAAQSVSAEVEEIPQSNLEVSVTGPGEVTSAPAGISCTSGGGTCTGHFDSEGEGSHVTLHAEPTERGEFVEWGGDCASFGSATTCELEMSEARTVSAEYTEINQRTITVEMPGSGQGSVEATEGFGSEFTKIECVNGAGTCFAAYNEGAEITLEAKATPPALFGGWSGCTATSGPGNELCHVALGASDVVVQATFNAAVAPTVTTEETTAIGRNAATVHGSFNPEGSHIHYRFAYVQDATYEEGAEDPYAAGSLTPETEGGAADTTVHHVTEALHSLKPGITYHYAILAEGPGGSARGEDMTFTTAAQPPSATTGPATGVGPDTATLTGSLDADGIATTYRFELGTTTAYTTTVFGSAGEEKGVFEVTLAMSGLQPATTYHYRLVAKNTDGTATGADRTFTTGVFPQGVLPPPPDLKPTPVNHPTPTCKSGFVRKHGKCVRKPHHRKHHHRKHHRRHGG